MCSGFEYMCLCNQFDDFHYYNVFIWTGFKNSYFFTFLLFPVLIHSLTLTSIYESCSLPAHMSCSSALIVLPNLFSRQVRVSSEVLWRADALQMCWSHLPPSRTAGCTWQGRSFFSQPRRRNAMNLSSFGQKIEWINKCCIYKSPGSQFYS